MSAQDIYNDLNAALSGGRITLTSSTVPGLGNTLLAYGIQTSGSLVLTSATLSLSGNSVVLTGTGSFLNFVWTITLTGQTIASGNQFTLVMLGQDAGTSWTFQTSFGSLPQSRTKTTNGTLPLVPSVLLPLVVQQPTMSVTTTPGLPIPEVGFQGTLVLSASAFSNYLDYLGSGQFQLNGTIDFINPADPVIDLSAVAPSADRNVPVVSPIEIGLWLRSHYPDNFALDDGAIISVLALYATIRLSSASADTATLSTPLLQGDGIWPVTVAFSSPVTISKGIGFVLDFLNLGAADGSLFTFPFADSVLNSFGLTGLEVGIQPPLNGKTLDIVYASFQFEATDTGLQWLPSLPFVKVTKLGTGWTYHWYGDTTFSTGSLWGELTFFSSSSSEEFDDPNGIILELTAAIPQYILTARNKGDINVPVGKVLKQYFGGSGGLSDSLTVKSVLLEAIPPEQNYSAYMTVDGIWSYTVNNVTFSLDQITGFIFSTQSKVFGSLQGLVGLNVPVTSGAGTVTKATFLVSADYRQDGTWKFAGGLADGTLSLTDLVYGLLGRAPSATLDLPTVNLTELRLSYETALAGSDNPYSASGALEVQWNPTTLGLTLSLKAEASFAYRKAITSRDFALVKASPTLGSGTMIYEGAVKGTFTINGLQVIVGLSFVDTQKVYLFEVTYNGKGIRATTRWINDTVSRSESLLPVKVDTSRHEILVITLVGLTLGGVVEYLVNLANPNQNYHLDAPWSFLNDIDLSQFELQIDASYRQTITFLYNINLNLPFIQVDAVGIRYDRSTGEGIVNFVVEGEFLGKDYRGGNALTWDAVNDPPPQVPGKGEKFLDLRYLGMGQHITLSGLTSYDSVADVLKALSDEMRPAKDQTKNPLKGSKLKFDAASQWMVGLDLSILDTVSAGIVLHDPDLYGLVVSLSGPKAGSMAGLSFELLYKKVTDTIGVFRVRLQVPDAFRQINVGAASVTLGIITVDVYTNGNFMVDLGFPHNRDFSASFGLQFGPFIGSGGIYFGLLNGATSRRVPVITNGVFDPVIELGLGVSAGIGRTFDKGPLKAGLYVQVLAIFEGVLAWFHPTDESASTVVYYWAQASVGIMGKLYGSVDFGIIRVSVSVEARAIVTVTLAAYRHTDIDLNVDVQVNAEVEILFFTISFSFSLTIHASFTIGEDQTTPWILAAGQTGFTNSLAPDNAYQAQRRTSNDVRKLTHRMHLAKVANLTNVPLQDEFTQTYTLNWPVNTPVFPDQAAHTVTVKMLPNYGVDQPPVDWSTMPTSGTNQYRLTFLLMVDNGVSSSATTIAESRRQVADTSATAVGDSETAFNAIIEGMLRWSVAAMGVNPVSGSVTPGQLQYLSDQLDMDEALASLSMTTLGGFFPKNLEFQVSGIPTGTPSKTGGTAFPIPPPLGWDAANDPTEKYKRRFELDGLVDSTYQNEVRQYFEKVSPQSSSQTSNNQSVGNDDVESMATFIFREYFLMIAKAAVQASLKTIASFPYTVLATDKLTDICGHFATLPTTYTKHAGDTVNQLAQFFGYSVTEITALNPTITDDLRNASVGATVAVNLGVTPESLTAANPSWPITPIASLSLGDISYQVGAGDTLSGIATRFGANVTTWLTTSTLLNQRMLLLAEAPLSIPNSSYVNSTSLSLAAVAAMFYVRVRGAEHLSLAAINDVPLVEWYAQAICILSGNSVKVGSLPVTLQIPSAFDNIDPQSAITYTTLTGDTLWSVAATFAILQNQSSDSNFGLWLQAVKNVNTGSDPLPRVILPPMASQVLPYETLAAVGARFPVELPISGQSGQYYDIATSFQMIVQSADILKPLTPIIVPDCVVSSTDGQTISSFGQLYDLSLEEVGKRLATVPGFLKATSGDLQFVVPNPPIVPLGSTTPTPADLITAVLNHEASTISNQVSRFLMYGLRMPAPVKGQDDKYHASGAMTGLYELIGQQLVGPIPPSTPPTPPPVVELSITVKNFDEVNSPWLTFYDSTSLAGNEDLTEEIHALNPGLRHRGNTKGIVVLTETVSQLVFDFTNVDLYSNYPSTTLIPDFVQPPYALPLAHDVPVQHSLPKRIFWQTTETIAFPNPGNQSPPLTGMPSLWNFSSDLLSAAEKFSSDEFQLWTVDPRLGPDAPAVEASLYAWASQFEIRIKRIAGRPNTYEMFGADVAGRQELLQIWQYLKATSTDPGTIHLLYEQSVSAGLPNGLSSQAPNANMTYIVKTNLSTETRSGLTAAEGFFDPPLTGDYYAPLSDATNFLRFVWECSVVGGGGYWFQYTAPDGTGLPDSIFQTEGMATLTLVVTLASQMSATTPDRHLHSFNNVALVGDSIDAGSKSLYVAVANMGEVVPQATVDPGNVAFGMELQKPPKNDPFDRQVALRQAYSLVGYYLNSSTIFEKSNPALPIGPAVKSQGFQGNRIEDENVWDISQVLPISRFAKARACPQVAGLPDPLADPYAGIGASGGKLNESQVILTFRDVLGNSSDENGDSTTGGPLTIPIPVGYTDPIVGLSAWPSTTTFFKVNPATSGSGATIAVTAALQASSHLPGGSDRGSLAAASSAKMLSTFTTIYYQLSQPQVEVGILSSLETVGGQPVALATTGDLLPFAAGTCAWLNTASQLSDVWVNPNATPTLAQVSNQFGVGLDQIAAANLNVTLSEIFANSGDVTIPSFAVFSQGATVASLCPKGTDPAQILGSAENIVLGLLPNQELVIPAKTFPVPTPTPPALTPSLNDIASSNSITPTSLVAANELTDALLQVGFIFTCEGVDVEITLDHPDVSLDDVAATFQSLGVQFDGLSVALANATKPGMFRAGAILSINRYIVKPKETLQTNGSGSTSTVLAGLNTTTVDLFPAGTTLYLGTVPATSIFNDTLATAARIYAVTPEQILWQNRTVALAANSGLIAVPGQSAWPATPANLRIPYSIPVGAILNDIAALFMNADSTGVMSAALALANANLNLAGVLAGNQTIIVDTQHVPTQDGDSFASVMARFNPPVQLSQIVDYIGGKADFLAEGALMMAAPAVLPSLQTAYTPTTIANLYGVTVAGLAIANTATTDLVTPNATLTMKDKQGTPVTITTGQSDTLNSLVWRFSQMNIEASVSDIVTNNAGVDFFNGGAKILLAPAPAILQAPFGNVSGWRFPSAVFPLHVRVNIQRNPDFINPDFANTSVVANESTVPPVPSTSFDNTDDGYLKLQQFASDLQANVPTLRVATGKLLSEERKINPTDVWCVAFGTGYIESLAIKPGQAIPSTGPITYIPQYYALRPLSNSLVSRKGVLIQPLNPNGILGTGVENDFQGVDLEAWVVRFLSDVDLFLSSPYASSAYQTPKRLCLESILKSKSELADGIANGLDYTLNFGQPDPAKQDPAPDDWSDARESLRQSLLVSLSQGYSIGAIMQYEATVKSAWTSTFARLSGPGEMVNATTSMQRRAKIGTAKTSLTTTQANKPSFVNFLIGITEPGTEATLDFQLDYKINELEFNIQSIVDGYDASDWLSFMLPFSDNLPPGVTIDLGNPKVPLPMRSYPPAPALLGQVADAPSNVISYTDGLYWQYAFTFQHQSAAVDHLKLDVVFNETPVQFSKGFVLQDDLFSTLAQYNSVAPALWSMLEALPTVTSPTPELLNAVQTFSDLVGRVAVQWKTYWTQTQSSEWLREESLTLSREEVTFKTSFDAEQDETTGAWYYTYLYLNREPSTGVDWPMMSVVVPGSDSFNMGRGEDSSKGRKYTMPPGIVAFTLVGFEMRFDGLHVAKYQNGSAKVSVSRNVGLSADGPTTSAFVFQTAPLAFPDLVVPLLSWRKEFPIGQWTNTESTNPLGPVFTNLFNADPSNRTINMGIRYGYVLAAQAGESITPSLPVKYRPSFTYQADPATGTIEQVISAVNEWSSLNTPTSVGSAWVFSLTLYSSIPGQTNRPVLEFSRLVSSNVGQRDAAQKPKKKGGKYMSQDRSISD